MIRFSRREDYAVILINTLAASYKKRVVPLSEIAKEYHISVLFLRNLAMELRNAGIIKAVEGKNGGYFLTKDPEKLKMGEVLSVFSKFPLLACCSVGTKSHGRCPKESFCRPGFVWRRLNKEFLERVSNLTISQFVNYK